MAVSTAQPGIGWIPPSVSLPEWSSVPHAESAAHGIDAWLRRLVATAVRHYNERPRQRAINQTKGLTEREHAHAVIRRSCVLTAATGGAIGVVATGASIAIAESGGPLGFAAVPIALAAMGVEAVMRSYEHLRMTCEIADLFDLRFDPDSPADLWALFALAFGAGVRIAEDGDPAEQILGVASIEGQSIAQELGARLVGESVARNIVPFLDIASSSITNWKLTRRLGDTVRRYARYRRAFDDVLCANPRLLERLDLLVEGAYFLFAADDRLTREETALLASLLRRCDPSFYEQKLGEALSDDIAWIERLPEIPESVRPGFFHALEVAAAVDKYASVRERKLLEHAARALHIPFDEAHLEQMIAELDATGVLAHTRRHS